MTSFHAHQLKRERQDRQWVLDYEPVPSAEPPAIAIGTRVIVHRRISPVAVTATVIGGHGEWLRVRADAGAFWTCNIKSLEVQND